MLFYFAEIVNGQADRVIVADSENWPASVKLPGVWVDVTALAPAPGPRWTYDSGTRKFSRPGGA